MMTLYRHIGCAAVLAAAGLGTAPAHAQANCAPRDMVLERLKAGYGETLTAGGLRSQSQVLEVWAATETGTWTVLVTTAEGMTCVLATGTNWHQNAPEAAAKGVPS